jgi:hypothetical protein
MGLEVAAGRAEERGDCATEGDRNDDHDERDDGDQDAVLCHRLTLLTAQARHERAREGNNVVQQGFTSPLRSCRLGRVHVRGELWPTGVTAPVLLVGFSPCLHHREPSGADMREEPLVKPRPRWGDAGGALCGGALCARARSDEQLART